MPQMSVTSYVSRPLTDYFVSVQQDESNFVAGRVGPSLPVGKQFDKYYIVPAGSMNRDEMKPRTPNSEAHTVNMELSDSQYQCEEFAAKIPVSQELRTQLGGEAIDPEAAATRRLSMMSLIRKEKIFAARFLPLGAWSGQKQGVAAAPGANQFLHWSDAASDPVANVEAWIDEFQLRSGLMPRRAVITRDVWNVVKAHPDILARVSGGSTTQNPALVTPNNVAAIFELEGLDIMGSVENTAGEGLAATNARIASKKFLLYRNEDIAGQGVATAMTWFNWTGLDSAYNNKGVRVIRHPFDTKKRNIEIEASLYTDARVTAADLGLLAYDVIA
jgi:hypothetical protein